MTSEITEEKDEETPYFINKEAEKERIRDIIKYQKSLYWSSSSSLSSSSASCSSFQSSHRSSSLLDLMKIGSTSLRRLFDMEHTTLATHFQEYSGSPITKSIPLWGIDADIDQAFDPWESVKYFRSFHNVENDGRSQVASDGSFKEVCSEEKNLRLKRRKLTRKKSFRRLPGFRFLRFRRFRFRLRLKRLRIVICGKIFLT